ncbi:16S rRNA (guanine(966)-N(2))-methyltransferase RsmD [Uruburuella testudinis]|uniref:16S rRNA (Guanine(966)-N(2))-methyltransferase RsmD n=1 Tax=Uruburuella testudinis TaxID=1282863 RepID=A0ABY4DRY8_9NEIS|nr:16S rRNA (guanine(966)-N(2))-methyltransferase RsmD [Uruburuella testudinis]UOO81799.1 16S rRNA (guanine(966)-N(2))-methyltransferase RsmD [Uruburuella testudinis]
MKSSKYSNQVRIVGGTHRGRKLAFADAEGLRPTPDRVREQVFNWLGQDLTGKSVLDLFSGSGALGLEAASRRAAKVVMVESNRQTARILQQARQTLALPQVEIVVSDGLLYLQQTQQQFDVVFLDPPFAWQQWPQLFDLLQGRLKNGAMVYIEAGRLPEMPSWLTAHRQGKAGISRFELRLYVQVAE